MHIQHEVPKGDKRTIKGWVLYDWANSSYQLTITSTIFPIYYNLVTKFNPVNMDEKPRMKAAKSAIITFVFVLIE